MTSPGFFAPPCSNLKQLLAGNVFAAIYSLIMLRSVVSDVQFALNDNADLGS